MIRFASVSKIFNKSQPNEVSAVSKLDLTIDDGNFLVVIGANGSGKSTFLNLISGTVVPSSGDIFLDDDPVAKLADYQRSKWIARVFQDPLKGTAPDLSILDNFRMAALRTQPKNPRIGNTTAFKKQVREKLAGLNMGFENKLDQPVGTLSGGQRQAITLLMCVMDDLKILLLDEPAAALDPGSAKRVMQMANTVVQELGLTAVLVTHQLKDAFRYGNRLIFMEEGEIKKDLDSKAKAALTDIELYSWFM